MFFVGLEKCEIKIKHSTVLR